MSKIKIAAVIAVAVLLGAGSLVSAQYGNLYGYSYPEPQYQQYQYGYPTPSYNNCPNLYSNITIGSRGAQVSELQRFLATRYNQLVTGYYGPQTAANVAAFQRANGLPATGGVGAQTRAAIMRSCQGATPTPYPYPYPYPQPTVETFRLDRAFVLDEGESAIERNGSLTVRLDQVGAYGWPYYYSTDTVRVTLSYSCRQGTYCFYAPQEVFILEEDEYAEFMGYEVEVRDIGSDRATFIVRDEDDDDNDNDDDDAKIDITAPTAGKDFEQGDEMRIVWKVTDEPNNSSVILDLYDEDDDRVGTIAILDSDEDDFEWDIPTGGGYCTQQYPNELCGYDLEGDYYIKARLVSGNGFNGGHEYDSDKSGTFTIED